MRVAVVLSGAGYLDGAEIRESVLSLLYLDQQGIKVDMFAPDVLQSDVVNHVSSQAEEEQRNVMQEAARIARGRIKPLSELNIKDYAGLVIPGGYGVAKNLSDFAVKGSECTVLPGFQSAIRDCIRQEKPIAAICIAPAVVAVALKGIANPELTIGDDKATADAIEACGATHKNSATTDCVVDKKHRIISCSAYMREDPIADVSLGIERAIQAFAGMVEGSLAP